MYAFTSGVGAILLLEALPIMLQIHTKDVYHPLDVIKNLIIYINHMNPLAFYSGIDYNFIARKLPKYAPKLPALLIAALIPTLIVWLFNLQEIQLVGTLPHELTILTHLTLQQSAVGIRSLSVLWLSLYWHH